MEPTAREAIQASIDRKAARKLERIRNDARKKQQLRATPDRSSPHQGNEQKHDRAQSNRQRDAATPPL